MMDLAIAIDGPAGAGKSTVARLVAEQLGLIYIDTGAMYRAITWCALNGNYELTDEGLTELTRGAQIGFGREEEGATVWVNNIDVTESIRSPGVTAHVSTVAGLSGVREILVEKQRQIAASGGVVMDGRDIGTHVLPHADIKIFLTASIQERAQRRFEEMVQKGYSISLEQLKEEIELRDEKDKNRQYSPLRAAEDAICVDTTGLSIEAVTDYILSICRTKIGSGE